MTNALEVLLELEYLQVDLVLHPLKVDSPAQAMKLLGLLQTLTVMIMKDIMGKDSLAHLRMIYDGDIISTKSL